MSLDFLILSTPRSGSAWLANLLTHGECFCWHDPMANGLDHKPKRVAPITGAIDTGIWNFPSRRPAARRMFALTREPSHVATSLRECELPCDPDFRRFREVTSGLVTFRYEQLFDVAYLEGLWRTIVGPSMFHVERAQQLIAMNVQRDLEQLTQLVRSTYGD